MHKLYLENTVYLFGLKAQRDKSLFFFLAVLGFELSALCLLGRPSTTWATPPAQKILYYTLIYIALSSPKFEPCSADILSIQCKYTFFVALEFELRPPLKLC
jgi:hypothetical protein